MKILIPAAGIGLCLALAAPAHAANGWQAIYYSPATQKAGYAWGKSTQDSAKSVALNNCVIPDCTFVVVSDACVALAEHGTLWGGGSGATPDVAGNDALQKTYGGFLVVVVCPGGPTYCIEQGWGPGRCGPQPAQPPLRP